MIGGPDGDATGGQNPDAGLDLPAGWETAVLIATPVVTGAVTAVLVTTLPDQHDQDSHDSPPPAPPEQPPAPQLEALDHPDTDTLQIVGTAPVDQGQFV